MLSCDVIIWDDNTPLFYFSWKLHSLISTLIFCIKFSLQKPIRWCIVANYYCSFLRWLTLISLCMISPIIYSTMTSIVKWPTCKAVWNALFGFCLYEVRALCSRFCRKLVRNSFTHRWISEVTSSINLCTTTLLQLCILLPALAVYLGEEEKTTEKGKIENRIVYFRKKKKHRKS